MAAKVVYCFLVIFIIFQLVNSIAIRREVSSSSPAGNTDSKAVGEAIDNLKKGVEDFLKQVQTNPLFQNITAAVQEFGESIQAQSKQIVHNIQETSQPK